MTERPIDGISAREAAEILETTEGSVGRLVAAGVLHRATRHHRALERGDVEQLALERYRPGEGDYWVGTVEAAQLFGVSREWVRRMVVADRLPSVSHRGRNYYRRHQVEVIANAREARRLGHRHGG